MPLVCNSAISADKQRELGLNFISSSKFSDFSGMNSLFWVPFLNPAMNRIAHNQQEDVWEDHNCPCVGTWGNSNLSGPQKKLLAWHWKLSDDMQRIQEMMWGYSVIDDDGKETSLTPLITPIFSSTPSYPFPMSKLSFPYVSIL